jgi:hypothetical protein
MIEAKGYVLSVTKKLTKLLEKEIRLSGKSLEGDGLILNFRDDSYSMQSGGYHPVEISINGDGIIRYITDFSYAGDGELYKEQDFDFSIGGSSCIKVRNAT